MPVALTIAGSDPSGGAGIQSDLRTFAALGVVGLSAITALTVQNSQGVQSVHPVGPDVLAAQLNAVLEDTRPDAVKIGMLGGAAQVRVVAEALRRFRPPHVVLDPVLASTGGVPLLDTDGRNVLRSELLPLCDLVTPNLDEAVRLGTLETMAVLVKGGHWPGEPEDRLTLRDGTVSVLTDTRVETPHTHGTGCLLSAAIAAFLAQGVALPGAVRQAKQLVTESLRHPVVVGQGRGYPQATRPSSRHAERLARLKGLYVLTDETLRPDRSHEAIVRAALAGGARVFQLRDKHLPTPELVGLARRLQTLVSEAQGLFMVNDRVDVALASEADGVHLGPDDMAPADARRLLGPDKLIGVSTGTLAEAQAAAPYASYLGVGAIFGSHTKLDAGAAVGLGRIQEIKAAFPRLPLVAIGGIHLGSIAEVAQAGADAAAVVSAVVAAPDMTAATQEFVRRFQKLDASP